jgi:uroporphyrinogen-III decarboxylase
VLCWVGCCWTQAKHPDTPIIYFANGGSSYLERQADMKADSICVDWKVDMAKARQIIPASKGISGNVDPLVLLGPEETIRSEVRKCVSRWVSECQGPCINWAHMGLPLWRLKP